MNDHASLFQRADFASIIGNAAGGQGPIRATFQHDLRRPPITEAEHAIRFYDDNYDTIVQKILIPDTKVYLGTKSRRHCRFCGRSEPEVTFRHEAHVIPESLGNRVFFSYYECDMCNEFFGGTIENNLGNWTLPSRTFARIRGKRGYPTVKHDRDGKWRIEAIEGCINITGDANPAFSVDEEKKTISVDLRRGSYTPIAVYKAFVKIGLTLLPDDELPNFRQTLAWIMDHDHRSGAIPVHPLVRTMAPGPILSNLFVLSVWRRKNDSLQVPYVSFAMTYGSEMIQVFLPTPERNANVTGRAIRLFRFPHLMDVIDQNYGDPESEVLDLSGTILRKGEILRAIFTYEEAIDRR